MVLIKKLFIYLKTVMIFEFYEQKYVENVYSKLNLAQSTKQKRLYIPRAITSQNFWGLRALELPPKKGQMESRGGQNKGRKMHITILLLLICVYSLLILT